MTGTEGQVATLEERSKQQGDRIEKLEANQRWGIMTILALIAKALLDYMGK